MDALDKLSLLTPIMLLMALMLLLVFYMQWRKDQKEKLEFEKKKFEIDSKIKKEQNQASGTKINIETANDKNRYSHDSGGYIVLDLPDEQRSLFHDLLKGFEEFAKLKGYEIRFSIDNTLDNQIAFKFTIGESGISVSTSKVRSDIAEYITKIRSGESFENLPTLISIEEHELVLTTLKNRLNFLQHSHNLQQNTIQFYENLLNRVSEMNQLSGISSVPSVFVQTGGTNAPLLNSRNSNFSSNEEKHLTVIDNSIKSKIKISKSFNKRKEQIGKIEDIVNLVRNEEKIKNEIRDELLRNILNIKEELESEEEPNSSRIEKGLENTKKVMSTMVLSHKTAKALEWLYNSFEFISNSSIG